MLRPLLRLLLCLCLLVDTLGPAVAATHLVMAEAGAQVADRAMPAGRDEATHGPADAGADCHTMRNTANTAPEPVAPAPGEDCLERCLDLCLQHGIAAVPAAPLLADRGIVWLPALVADAQVDTAHAAPLLRPPIA